MPVHDTKYHLWSVATKKKLVLTVSKDGKNGTIAGKERHDKDDDGPEESSNVKILRATNGPSVAICWRIVFTHGDKDYALHIENNTVTAMRVPDENELKKAAYFVPTLRQPFVAWEVKSSGPSHGKYLVVNVDGSLSVKAIFNCTECRQTATFVKIEVHDCKEEKTTKEIESSD